MRSVHDWAVWMEVARRKAARYKLTVLDAFRRVDFSRTASSGVSARNPPEWTLEERVDDGPASSRCCLVGEDKEGCAPRLSRSWGCPGRDCVDRSIAKVASWEAFFRLVRGRGIVVRPLWGQAAEGERRCFGMYGRNEVTEYFLEGVGHLMRFHLCYERRSFVLSIYT